MSVDKTKRVGRWYFGGTASAMAACCTHPLDLMKVHLQTQQTKIKVTTLIAQLYKSDGIMGFYNGLSASITRQLTYSMTRFAIYETVKKNLTSDGGVMPLYQKVGTAAFAGAIGGFVGTPPDLVNVRMQNDVKLPKEQRRNYKHAIDGLYRVFKEEGFVRMYSGATMASSRAVLVTVGQLAGYDQIKQILMKTGFFKDNTVTHLTCSTLAGCLATMLTMPLDVMKTRMMNKSYPSILACAADIAKTGPSGFFKGFMPAFVRLGPHTVFTFIFFEQIRLNFGDDPNYKHAIDGLYRVFKEEGFVRMYSGATMASSRAVLVTVGQLAGYDQIKQMLMKTGFFKDNTVTHLTCSTLASILACAADIAKTGPSGFFKGFMPAFVRLGPHTVFTFIFFEQIRLKFGDDPK